MKKRELIKVIELIVRKEVKKQVNEIFIKENKQDSLKSLAQETIQQKPRPVVKKQEKVTYTSNDSLNEILNETVGLSKGDVEDEYPTMGGGVFDSSRASELLGYGDSMMAGGDKETQRNINAAVTMKEAGVSSEQVPESLVNALTRDYSDLMKHDKFKGKK
jgi:hypothetical protein|tara:strand:+ start:1585 stop:2067 length:483 start_codon:yes stop_codon:yes gene_type:complete